MDFNKRKAAIKARAGGVPLSPRANVDVTLLATKFAAKLKMRVKERKEPSAATRHMDAVLAKRGVPRAQRPSYEPTEARDTPTTPTSKSPREQSWTAKRKEAYLRKYGFEREDAVTNPDVAVSAVAFVSKLKSRLQANNDAASKAPTQPSSPGRTELSWTARRKQAYLRKYGRARETPVATPDVAVSAVVFAGKLKRLAREGKEQSEEGAVALM